jgi:transaldolase / glucose-6-phosphate isomerase
MSGQVEQATGLRLGRYTDAVEARLRKWEEAGFGRRIWQKDHALWSPRGPVPELTNRLGWLELPVSMQGEVERLARLGAEVRAEGIRHAVVLGMGGSSLAPEVFSRTFGPAPGFPDLYVLDSTHPDAVRAVPQRIDLGKSLFVVSSKSGTTTEMLSFFHAFWSLLRQTTESPGRHFVAVTDPGTPLETLARERGFRAVVNAPEDVGGRYSALTPFGLVPAALLGVDLGRLLESARQMAEACGPQVPVTENPGLSLGAALGELALAGRDKVTFFTTPAVEAFPDWIEQLVAESTGKATLTGGGEVRRGIVPVAGELPGPSEAYGTDRFFVGLFLGEDPRSLERSLSWLEAAGHPVAWIRMRDAYDLGAEMFRWELATAAAGAVIDVNPFDQPDVQLAKELATQAMQEPGANGAAAAQGAVEVKDSAAVAQAFLRWLQGVRHGDYLGLHAYLAPTPHTTDILRALQRLLHRKTRLATTLGYGPRFLHSTGQLHKGGPATGHFLQLVDVPKEDLAVPETDYTFGRLIRAQADGDRRALERRGRHVLRLQLGVDPEMAMDRLLQDLASAI